MEILLPAGNIESFFAAIEGGADAIYLGLKNFNARKRAKNFSYNDIYNIIKEAHNRKIKIYITVNTLVKNNELPELIQSLSVLSQLKPDAIIIQDFAIIKLVRERFKNLKLHASTQMVTHNSIACNFFEKENFERVILARELTKNELSEICKKTNIDKEIFIHGALCYSYSGYCLFSSYLGGNSGNRGNCTQVCRRNFYNNNDENAYFSLKDQEQINHISFFKDLNIKSLKIEGRMKNKEYVYNTAKAYKTILNNNKNIDQAKKILETDYAREKTDFFYAEKLKNIFTNNSGIGKYIGKTQNTAEKYFDIITECDINIKSYIRIQNEENVKIENLKINNIEKFGNNYRIYCNTETIANNFDVYLIGNKNTKLKGEFKNYENKKITIIPDNEIKKILFRKKRNENSINTKEKYYLRINNIKKLKEINTNKIDKIFLKLKLIDLIKEKEEISKIIDKSKYIIELPKIINEKFLPEYQKLLYYYKKKGFSNFGINHISQIEIIPKETKIFSCENIYLLNDLAIEYVKNLGISEYIYPLENDYPNLIKGNDRKGIITIYFTAELFYSRVPINAHEKISDRNKNIYNINKENGLTIITDTKKVSLTQYCNKLKNKGFHKFLIDLSYNDNYRELNNILEKIKKSEKIENTNDFNFKKELR